MQLSVLTHKQYFFIILGLCVAGLALFFLRKDIRLARGNRTPAKPAVKEILNCAPGNLDASVLSAHRVQGDDVWLRIGFNEQPSTATIDFLQYNGVIADSVSWSANSLRAVTTVSKLCFLADLPGITGIELLK